MTPQRIQLRRTKGWRMPPDTVKVDRTTKYGNPFVVGDERTAAEAVQAYRAWLVTRGCDAGAPVRKAAVLAALPDLRGKNLACWCKPGEPCHADVLLEIANAPSIRPNEPVQRPSDSEVALQRPVGQDGDGT